MNLTIESSIPALAVFLQGLFSFFSPCVLPLVPLYIGYLAGGTGTADENGIMRYPRKKVMLNTIFFIIGVSFAFFLLGFGFTTAGKFFSGNRAIFARVGGILVILFGVYQLGILGSSRLMQQEHRLPFRLQSLAMNPLVALVMGFTFSFAWTPCVGPALTGVLIMASSAQQATQGYLLIGVYTLGFVLPFLAVGLFTGQLLDLFKKHRNLLRYTVKAGGVLMILMGIMMYTGWMNGITGYLSQFGAAPTPPTTQSTAPSPTIPTPTPTPDSSPKPEKAATPAPDFTFNDQFGNSHTLSDYKGKVVFLNFWATWCGYCVKEMPDIQKLYDKYSTEDSEVVILGAANPKTPENPRGGDVTVEELTTFLSQNGYSYPSIMDTTGEVFSAYAVSSLPTTFMIDKDGNIFGYVSGMLTPAMMEDIIKQTLEASVAEPAPPETKSSSALPTPVPTGTGVGNTFATGNTYIQSLAAAAVDKLPPTSTNDFERVQAAYEYLIATTYFAPPIGLDSWQVHDGELPSYIENHALSPLAYGIGSCEDFACAMVLLLEQLGLESQYVPGITISVQGDFVDHAWAAVRLRGNWYHLDPQLEDNIIKEDMLRYRYFLKSDEELLIDHRWGSNLLTYATLTDTQRQEVEESYLLPACVKTYPTPKPIKLGSMPRPNTHELTTAITAERAAYELVHGALPRVNLNIIPPVFGNGGYGPPD